VKKPLRSRVYANEHTLFENAIKLNKFAYALQYIHGSNVSNQIRGYAVFSVDLSSYGITFARKRSFFAALAETIRLNAYDDAKTSITKKPKKIVAYVRKRLCAINRSFQS
jgi:hypothetical protein